MATFEHELTIARPPAEVFAYLTDVRNLPSWQDDVVEIRPEGQIGPGARFVEVRSFLGKRVESTLEVADYAPDRVFSLRVVSGPVPIRIRHLLEPDGEGTRLRVEAEGDPGGLFRLAQPLVIRQAEKAAKRDFAALKRLLEQQA